MTQWARGDIIAIRVDPVTAPHGGGGPRRWHQLGTFLGRVWVFRTGLGSRGTMFLRETRGQLIRSDNEWIDYFILHWIKSAHTLSSQDDNRWHVAMFLKFVNVTKLQFLLFWQVFWHSVTEEIFINVFTTASPDGLQRKELNSHSLCGSAEIGSGFSGISLHKTCCDPTNIVIKRIENMLQLNIFTRFTSLPSKKFKPHKINNKIKVIREKLNCYFLYCHSAELIIIFWY